MASLIQSAKSALGGGRDKVTLIGLDKSDKKVEIELDLVETFDATYQNTISNHTIEKDPNVPVSKITDHVNSDNPTIVCNCVLADNLNVISSAASLSNKAVGAKDKLKQIIYWQKSGSVITIEGYTVGSNGFGKLLNYLNGGIGNFNSDLDEPYYAGMVNDRIENIVIGNVNPKNQLDLGNNIFVTLNFQRAQIAEAETTTRDKIKSGVTPIKKGPAKTQTVNPKKEIKKSTIKGGN